MREYDALVLGGGLLGCFAARSLTRLRVSVALIEAREDVCTGISRANTAIIYPGYDNKAGTLKAELTVRANSGFDTLCSELGVRFSRRGSLMVSRGPRADAVLEAKLAQGEQNGVPGLRIISGGEARELEPELAPTVSRALFSPNSGTVDPWELGIAAYENALKNGCEAHLNTRVLGIVSESGGYVVRTDGGDIRARVIINCAGLYADAVQELLFPPSVRIFPTGADYLVLDKAASKPVRHILMHEPEDGGRGINAVPTVDGALLLGESERPLGVPFATDGAGLRSVREMAAIALPGLDTEKVIRSFASVRPNPHNVTLRDGEYVPDGRSIGSFVIENPGAGFWSLIGVKTPGLTCANELGLLLADKAAGYLGARPNGDFDPVRPAPLRVRDLSSEKRAALIKKDPDGGEIVCRCEDITRLEIIDAVRRGARTVDGVKRRCGAMMGRCQGARCAGKIADILARQLGEDIYSLRKDGPGSNIYGEP